MVPGLASEVQGELRLAETGLFMESRSWSVLDHPFRPTESEFAILGTAHNFEIDLEGTRITHRFVGEAAQLPLDVDVEGWTPETLILWLDGQVRQPDVAQSDLLKWLAGLVDHLAGPRGLPIPALMRCKFVLARVVRRKIDAIRGRERECAYQEGLFAPEAKPKVSFDCAFTFRDSMYAGERRYRGGWRPVRHFLGADRVPALDGKDDGEEIRCAQALDRLPGLEYWVRNVARHPASFWLPTATDRFYPDFMARSRRRRLLVVEYKGGGSPAKERIPGRRGPSERSGTDERGQGVVRHRREGHWREERVGAASPEDRRFDERLARRLSRHGSAVVGPSRRPLWFGVFDPGEGAVDAGPCLGGGVSYALPFASQFSVRSPGTRPERVSEAEHARGRGRRVSQRRRGPRGRSRARGR